MILSKENIEFLEHYGVKGMRWGVRKDRKSGGRSSGVSVAKKVGTALLIGNPNTSLVTKKGRENAKKDIAAGKAAISKLTSSKAFKTLIFDKDANILTKKGREGLAKKFKADADARYKKALAKEKSKKAAAKAKDKEVRALIDKLIKEDKATNDLFGKPTDEAADRKFWENLFKDDLYNEADWI